MSCRYTILLSCLFVFAGSMACAAPKPCFQDTLQALVEEVRTGDWFRPEDTHAVQAIQENIALSTAEQAEKTFEVYLNARLRGLPEEDRQSIFRIVAQAKSKPSKNEVDGVYNIYIKKIGLRLPPSVKDTALEKAIFIHEIEHALQDLVTSRPGSRGLFIRRILDSVGTRFLLEEGAMVAELRALKLIPKDERVRLIAEIQSLPKREMDKSSRALCLRMLQNADMDIDGYLAAQRESGRYSAQSIGKAHWLPMVPVTVLAGGLIGLALACGYTSNPSALFAEICIKVIKVPPGSSLPQPR
jgi:hypothetical protein